MAPKKYNVAVIGATGLVGSELIMALAARKFPVAGLSLYASWNTAGEGMAFAGEEIKVEPIRADFYRERDLVFFTAPFPVSRDLAPSAAAAGSLVLDCSSAFRRDPAVPLVVPEVNPEVLVNFGPDQRIIASPGPAAVAVSLAAAPLHRKWRVRRLIATLAFGSTAAGRAAFEEHQFSTLGVFNQSELPIERFPRQSAFNLFPKVGEFGDHRATTAEQELMEEIPRLLGAEIPVSVTAAQVPVFCGLAVSLHLELAEAAPLEAVREQLAQAPGVLVMDDPENEMYPDTLTALAHDEILVGRIRTSAHDPKSIQLWIAADNLRKGAALNLVQIAEALIKKESKK